MVEQNRLSHSRLQVLFIRVSDPGGWVGTCVCQYVWLLCASAQTASGPRHIKSSLLSNNIDCSADSAPGAVKINARSRRTRYCTHREAYVCEHAYCFNWSRWGLARSDIGSGLHSNKCAKRWFAGIGLWLLFELIERQIALATDEPTLLRLTKLGWHVTQKRFQFWHECSWALWRDSFAPQRDMNFRINIM